MDAMKCDRCGRYSTESKWLDGSAFKFDRSLPPVGKGKDVCLACAESFEDWWKFEFRGYPTGERK